MISPEEKHSIWHKNLPSEQEKKGLKAPGASIDIISVKDVEAVLGREARVPEEKDYIVKLAMDVADDYNGGIEGGGVNPNTVCFFVENLGSSEHQTIEDGNRHKGREIGGRKIPGTPFEGGHEMIHPF